MKDSGVAFYLGDIQIRWYGIIIALGVILAVTIATRICKNRGLTKDHIYDFALLAIPLGIIGARLYYVLFTLGDYHSLMDVLAIWSGGLAIYGAVIGGAIAAFIFARFRKINLWALLDVGAVVLILAQALGRWGNFFNQEAYGNLVTDAKWQFFPFAVYIENSWSFDPVGWYQATFFYESMWNLLVFAALICWMYGVGFFGKINTRWAKSRGIEADRPKMAMPAGNLMGGYLFLYGIGRACIEPLRSDSLTAGSMRVSFVLSLVLIVAGAALIMWNMKNGIMAPQFAAEEIKPKKNPCGDCEKCPGCVDDGEFSESASDPEAFDTDFDTDMEEIEDKNQEDTKEPTDA